MICKLFSRDTACAPCIRRTWRTAPGHGRHADLADSRVSAPGHM